MKKNDYFIDVSSYQPADLTAICQSAGTRKTIIKVSEGTGYLSPNRFTQAQTSEPIGYYHFARFGGNVSQAVAQAKAELSDPIRRAYWQHLFDQHKQSTANKANTAPSQPTYKTLRGFTLAQLNKQINEQK